MVDVLLLQGRPTDEVFTFEADDGSGIWHFNVSAVERWLYDRTRPPEETPSRWQAAGLKWGEIQFPREQVEEVILPRKLFEEERVAQLVEPYLSKPIITVIWPDDTTVLIDGTHRMIRKYREGAATIRMIQLPYKFAMNFSIDLPGRGTLDVDSPRLPNDARGDYLRRKGLV